MSVSANYKSELTVVETIDGSLAPFVSSGDKTVTHNGLNSNITIDAGTGVPATKTAAFELALSSGAGTIDLTALTGTNGGTVSFSGLKVQAVKFKNKDANANTITIAVGASNGYNLAGADFSLTLAPGQEISLYLKDQAPDVGSGAKTLDITGTGAQVLQVQLVAG